MDIRAGTEKKDHAAKGPIRVSHSDNRLHAQRFEVHPHQRMGESNFGTIDGTIPCCFEDG